MLIRIDTMTSAIPFDISLAITIASAVSMYYCDIFAMTMTLTSILTVAVMVIPLRFLWLFIFLLN